MEEQPICAIPGVDVEPLTKGEFNRLISQVRYYHLRPLRDDMKDMKHILIESDRIMQSHIQSDKEFFDKIAGARWALWAVAVVLAPVVPLLYYLIKALNTAGVL